MDILIHLFFLNLFGWRNIPISLIGSRKTILLCVGGEDHSSVAILTRCVLYRTLLSARCVLTYLDQYCVFGRAVAYTFCIQGYPRHRRMKLIAAIRTLLRLRPLNAAVLVLPLSVSGWVQQAPPASQTVQAATRHIETIQYRNRKYGFRFTLPESWKGYRVSWSEWEGRVLVSDGNVEHVLRGPLLIIRHPKWTRQIRGRTCQS